MAASCSRPCAGWGCGPASSTTRSGVSTGDNLDEIDHAELTPSGQFVLTLKSKEQSSTKADIARLTARLHHIEELLITRR
jgi:hypothetical protein